jgi:hypothetical protein
LVCLLQCIYWVCHLNLLQQRRHYLVLVIHCPFWRSLLLKHSKLNTLSLLLHQCHSKIVVCFEEHTHVAALWHFLILV